jgi:hypothetical protein
MLTLIFFVLLALWLVFRPVSKATGEFVIWVLGFAIASLLVLAHST